MEILIVPLLIGVAWVAGAIGLFVWMVRRGSLDHSDRLALLPLRDDTNAKNTKKAPRGQENSKMDTPRSAR